ncbi:hypothetical protein FBEOM_4872 [Fusarium beomiforme]|uniref:DUF7908 domain-containing protein n=1 Tax=Fusarium beomiforme TaxID=44412 RepID=A0A9P5AMB7_9HYPO|nr:hypothetical protein FBEOM_4872 [Fusarium beomiforme]
MIAKAVAFAVLAAHVAAGPCKPGGLSSNTYSTTAAESTSEMTSETSVLDSVITTSSEQATTTTDAASTTTTASVPAGEAIIFQVNPQRRLAKRDTSFVGINNPTECTFASVFRLDDGKLLENGVPIYYAGTGYQQLAAQGEPPAGSVTTTFSISGDRLSWTDESFGEAGFCQTESDGQVYITFGSEPVGCEAVTLTAYREEQCQNGEIVGQETSSAETTRVAETTASSDTVEPTTSVEAATTADACVVGIGGLNGQPPRASRLSDCSSLYTVTVSPYPQTATVFKREVAWRIPTGFPTWRPAMNTLAARAEGEPTATTIQPTDVPAYATYCDSPEAYYAACSDAGITGFTTTLIATPTSTSTTTVSDCPAKRLVRRAGEHMGYEFEDNWDAHIMPGYKLF